MNGSVAPDSGGHQVEFEPEVKWPGVWTRLSSWVHERRSIHEDGKTVRVIPWLPFAALVGALITLFLALVTLLAINHKPSWPSDGVYAFVQPASVLSLFLSFTAILTGYALSEGVSDHMF